MNMEKRWCNVLGCGRIHRARGFCTTHYARLSRNGTPAVNSSVRTVHSGGPLCSVPECNRPSKTALYCRLHAARLYRTGNVGPAHAKRADHGKRRKVSDEGYVVISGSRYPGGPANGGVLEHRAIMEACLGRPLLKEERVHHINGIKDDNRPSNLELWTVSHPSGQRVVDILHWAKLFIARYDTPEITSEPS